MRHTSGHSQVYKVFGNPRLRFGYSRKKGTAALIITLSILVIILVIGLSISFDVVLEQREANNRIQSLKSYYIAESAVEDYILRLIRGETPPGTQVFSSTLFSGEGSTEISWAPDPLDPNIMILTARADVMERARELEVHVKEGGKRVQFNYGVQVGDGGLTMNNNAVINGSVYSNGNIIGSNGARITGDAAVAGGISDSPSVEWATHNADQYFATNSDNRDIAQSFIAPLSDDIVKISVYLGKVGNPSSNITLRIAEDNGGKPDTSSLASETISASQVGLTPSWIDVSFGNPPTLASGEKYWIVIDTNSDSSSNYWNWRKDSTDGYVDNTGTYTKSWSSGSAVWTDVGGDLAFRVWMGGIVTKIDTMIIGDASSGTGRANLFENTTIHGSVCPNQYCIAENPPRENLPISDGVIQDWRNDAAAGGICVPPDCDASGNFSITNGATASLGPIQISGNLSVSNNAILTVSGTIWVQGNINLSNGCRIQLDPLYGKYSGVIIADGEVSVSNNCTFSGSGQTGSYIMILSAKNDHSGNVMQVSNNSLGVIFYANNGNILFSNNSSAKEATAYGIRMDNNATIIYDSGLINTNFSSGPAGGFEILEWREK